MTGYYIPPTPQEYEVNCVVCYDTLECQLCDGSGNCVECNCDSLWNPKYDCCNDGYCINCNGTGKCATCCDIEKGV